MKKSKKKVDEALLRMALGGELVESKEEYELQDGKMVLTKKKVSKKAFPPEVKALKLLLMAEGEQVQLSDEELVNEKKRLLRELEDCGK